jgi:DNA-directed RNA polymerase sigma subunit (sigma70/sigma32)
MVDKWIRNERLLCELRKKKELELKAAGQPLPSIESSEDAFVRDFTKAAIETALLGLSDADRELISVLYHPDSEGVYKTLMDLARKRGWSRNQLRGHVARILLQLRRQMR